MTTVKDMTQTASVKSAIAKGAAVNFIGTISKVLGGPVLYILLTRLYGKAPMGIFLVAYNIIEIVSGMAIAGLVDGVMMFTSRYIHNESDKDLLYSYIRRFFILTAGIGFFFALLGIAGAPILNSVYYSEYPALARLLQLMAFIIPLEAITRLAVAIPKSRMNMHDEVIVIGGVAPVMTLGLSVLFWYFDMGVLGIALAFVITYGVTLFVAMGLLSRTVDIATIFKGRFNRVPTKGILTFAIPQNLNLAFNRFISSMDVIMLAGFGYPPEQVAFYSLGAQIVRNGRQIRLIFSGSYAPIIARYFHEKRTGELNHLFATVNGWIISIALPVLFIMGFFRHDLLKLFSSDFTERPDFMLILLISPFWNCATGLAGNAIVMSGFSKWNLANSLGVGIANFLLNMLLIPTYGLWGAAVATAAAISFISIIQIIEARVLIGIRTPLRTLLPWMATGALLFVPPFFMDGVNDSLVRRLVYAAIPLAIYL
ncbi:MAG: polysaccharide biosynthesis C-terminal domain-containing protein, partial [Deltaproteobacteria bacterium]|nr:polysaccharide biosynthesis C-terminal domain-containing protein [Deltaproteobacteria bacterium]